MKIDYETPSDAPSADPTPPTDYSEVTNLLDPLRARFAHLLNFQLPAHTSVCPVYDVSFTLPRAAGITPSFSLHNDGICQFLEVPSTKTLIQSLLLFTYTFAAIRVVLKA